MLRNDFVSNSSSTSFAIIGKDYYIDDLIERIKEKENREFDSYDESREYVWDYLHKLDDLDISRGLDEYGDDCVIIGMCYERMKKDETREQFEKRIIETMKKYKFPVDKVEFILDQSGNG
jgi:hypothetical protein